MVKRNIKQKRYFELFFVKDKTQHQMKTFCLLMIHECLSVVPISYFMHTFSPPIETMSNGPYMNLPEIT